MLVGYRVLLVEGDDDSLAVGMDIRQFAQGVGFFSLCLFFGNGIGDLDGQFVVRDIEVHFDIGVVEIHALVVWIVSIFSEQGECHGVLQEDSVRL